MEDLSAAVAAAGEKSNNMDPLAEGQTSSSGPESTEDVQMIIARMMEEKHTFTYKKLVVPMSMRSVYWKFFGFPATEDGDILTKVKIVCVLCKTHIAYNRNTSNLRMHLQNKHPKDLMELESTKPPKNKFVFSDKEKKSRKSSKLINAATHIFSTNMDGTVEIGGDIQFVTDPNITLANIEDEMTLEQPVRVSIKAATPALKSEQITYVADEQMMSESSVDEKTLQDVIAEFIIIDLQLPEIVEGRGFQRLIATLKSPCEIPSKSRLEEDIIPRIYDSFRESVSASLACNSAEFGLAIEEWRSYSEEQFLTFSVYYQMPGESNLEMKVLNTMHAPFDWSEIQWGNAIDTFFADWDLNPERITAVVLATPRSDLHLALANRELIVIPCLLHTLHLCAQACFENAEVAAIIAKCRSVIGAIMGHSTASMFLTEQERLLELEENGLVMDYPSVWMSTYNMLEQIFVRRNIVISIMQNIEGMDQEYIDISGEQWKVIEDLVVVLDPFKVTILTLSEQKMPIISLIKPLLWQLVSSHMKPKDTDSDFARSLKQSLSEMLIDRYVDPSVTLLLQIATALDPRFKQIPYASDEDKNLAARPIKEMLTKLIQDGGCEEDEINVKIENERQIKKSRLSGMELLLGNFCATGNAMNADEKADLELVQYQSESGAQLYSCPLHWWTKISAKCPNLSKLARRYNCVPACCAPPSRIPAEIQIDYDMRRASLPPHLIDRMLFLHGNHTV